METPEIKGFNFDFFKNITQDDVGLLLKHFGYKLTKTEIEDLTINTKDILKDLHEIVEKSSPNDVTKTLIGFHVFIKELRKILNKKYLRNKTLPYDDNKQYKIKIETSNNYLIDEESNSLLQVKSLLDGKKDWSEIDSDNIPTNLKEAFSRYPIDYVQDRITEYEKECRLLSGVYFNLESDCSYLSEILLPGRMGRKILKGLITLLFLGISDAVIDSRKAGTNIYIKQFVCSILKEKKKFNKFFDQYYSKISKGEKVYHISFVYREIIMCVLLFFTIASIQKTYKDWIRCIKRRKKVSQEAAIMFIKNKIKKGIVKPLYFVLYTPSTEKVDLISHLKRPPENKEIISKIYSGMSFAGYLLISKESLINGLPAIQQQIYFKKVNEYIPKPVVTNP